MKQTMHAFQLYTVKNHLNGCSHGVCKTAHCNVGGTLCVVIKILSNDLIDIS